MWLLLAQWPTRKGVPNPHRFDARRRRRPFSTVRCSCRGGEPPLVPPAGSSLSRRSIPLHRRPHLQHATRQLQRPQPPPSRARARRGHPWRPRIAADARAAARRRRPSGPGNDLGHPEQGLPPAPPPRRGAAGRALYETLGGASRRALLRADADGRTAAVRASCRISRRSPLFPPSPPRRHWWGADARVAPGRLFRFAPGRRSTAGAAASPRTRVDVASGPYCSQRPAVGRVDARVDALIVRRPPAHGQHPPVTDAAPRRHCQRRAGCARPTADANPSPPPRCEGGGVRHPPAAPAPP